KVTGVQTCALPICIAGDDDHGRRAALVARGPRGADLAPLRPCAPPLEERRHRARRRSRGGRAAVLRFLGHACWSQRQATCIIAIGGERGEPAAAARFGGHWLVSG